MDVLKQEYIVTSQFNREMLLESLRAQLDSMIFKELINNEKDSLKVTFTISVDE